MRLTDYEKKMLDGAEGPARSKALELLIKYGDAVAAERFVETGNVCAAINAGLQFIGKSGSEFKTIDDLFSEYYLDSGEYFTIPQVKCYSCRLITYMDGNYWELQGLSRDVYELNTRMEEFCKRIGMQLTSTCAPYLLGNIPVKGEHCSWMESSAVIYINSVLGARTNTEGCETSACSMLTGRTPYWGLHIDQNRLGSHLIQVEYDVESIMDWGLLGYYLGGKVLENIPVIQGVRKIPNTTKLKHHGAAAATSGGVELYHIVGVTPEARTLDEAIGGKKTGGGVQVRRGRTTAGLRKSEFGRGPQGRLYRFGLPSLRPGTNMERLQAARRQKDPPRYPSLDFRPQGAQGNRDPAGVHGNHREGRRGADVRYLPRHRTGISQGRAGGRHRFGQAGALHAGHYRSADLVRVPGRLHPGGD